MRTDTLSNSLSTIYYWNFDSVMFVGKQVLQGKLHLLNAFFLYMEDYSLFFIDIYLYLYLY